MDPATLAFIASALGTGLITATNKILEKGVIDPALEKGLESLRKLVSRGYEKKRDEEKLRNALEAAIAKTGVTFSSSLDITAHAWVIAMEAMKAKPELAAKVAAATLELTRENDANLIHPALLRELKVQGKREEFARFLSALRGELVKIDTYREAIHYADELAARGYLQGLFEKVTAASGDGFFWTKEVPPNEKPYLNYKHKIWRRLSLMGRDTKEGMANRADGEMQLDQVYVALNTRETRSITVSEEKQKQRGKAGPEVFELQRQSLSALRALSDSPRMVLLGDPGSGKSTFVQHVCLCLAGARAGDEAWLKSLTTGDVKKWELPTYFPLFVRLREFATDAECLPQNTEQPGTAAHLLKFIKKQMKSDEWNDLADHVQQLLEDGEVLVVLDGLDEVTHPHRDQTPNNMPKADDDRRAQVARAIEDFSHNRFYHARVIVTCRVKQYRAEGGTKFNWQLAAFPDYALSDFDNKQIDQFIRAWFASLAHRLDNAAVKRDELIKQVAQRNDLKPLAPKPILLTQMALVHANSNLPDSRIELYQKCADLLLWEWESLRGGQGGAPAKSADNFIEELNVPNLRRDKIEAALYKAVFITHAAGHPDLLMETLRDHLTQALMSHQLAHYRADAVALQFIEEWLQQRNGLIVPGAGTSFEFPHRTFREFMAGKVLAKQGYVSPTTHEGEDWEEIAPRLVKEDATKWRDVFAFAAGYEGKFGKLKRVAEALELLCDENLRPTAHSAPAYLLAGEIIRDADPTNFNDASNKSRYTLYQRIQNGLIHLMRDSGGAAYPNDKPNTPPTSAHTLTPETRLKAGLLLDSLGWTPSDLHNVITIRDTKSPFAISKYPVTNWQYARFLNSSDYADEKIWQSIVGFDEKGKPLPKVGAEAWDWFKEKGGKEFKPRYWDDARFGASHRLLPVVGVSWYEVAAYCVWLERHWRDFDDTRAAMEKTFGGKFTIRLLREEEWVTAAGGEQGDRHAWGKEEDTRPYMNTDESQLGATSPVCMYPAGESPLGVMDMSGNVWEWQSADGVLCGGAWNHDEVRARVVAKGPWRYSDFWDNIVGFRGGLFPVL